jgi:hypothetical protein
MSFFSSTTTSILLVVCLVLPTTSLTGAFSSVLNNAHRHLLKSISNHYLTQKHSPLNDEPWEKDDSYWDMLQAASKDPETFEKFIDESMARSTRTSSRSSSSSSMQERKQSAIVSPSEIMSKGINGNDDVDGKKTKKYIPIEQWEEQRKNGENMTWEERLQWESQRSGDQFRQNEILRQNLKQF